MCVDVYLATWTLDKKTLLSNESYLGKYNIYELVVLTLKKMRPTDPLSSLKSYAKRKIRLDSPKDQVDKSLKSFLYNKQL